MYICSLFLTQKIIKLLSNKSHQIKNCEYKLIQNLLNLDLDYASQNILVCKPYISSVITELDDIKKNETNSKVKDEYGAMSLDYEAASLMMDFSSDHIDLLTKNLSKAEKKTKIENNRVLIAQYIDDMNKLQFNYSFTDFYIDNYGNPQGDNERNNELEYFQDMLNRYDDDNETITF